MTMLMAVLALAAQEGAGADWVRDPAFQAANNAFVDCAERALAADAASTRNEGRAVDRAFRGCQAEEEAVNAIGIRLRGQELGRHTGAAMRLIFRDRMIERLRALGAALAATVPASPPRPSPSLLRNPAKP